MFVSAATQFELTSASPTTVTAIAPTLNQSQSRLNMCTIPSKLSLNRQNGRSIAELRDEIAALKRHEVSLENFTERLDGIESECLKIKELATFHEQQQRTIEMVSEKTQQLEANVAEMKTLSNETPQEQNEMKKSLNDAFVQLSRLEVGYTEMIESLRSKADYDVLRTKVSLEHFTTTTNQLKSNLLELKSQLSLREENLKQSFDDVHCKMNEKTCKTDFDTITDRLGQKIEKIHDRLKAFGIIMRENEAAGTKIRLLKGVKCISCHSDAVMRVVEDIPVPKKDPMSTPKMMRKSNRFIQLKASKHMRNPAEPYSNRISAPIKLSTNITNPPGDVELKLKDEASQ